MRAAGVNTIGQRDDVLRIIDDEARSGEALLILVRAHGTKEETENLLSAEKLTPNFSVVDCTCPHSKACSGDSTEWKRTKMLSFYTDWSAEHPEVRGNC